MRVLLIDNYDSFTYNLVQLLQEACADLQLILWSNDRPISELPDHVDTVLISPGPGLPSESGNLMELIAYFVEKRCPVLGVCLGHQALAVHFGAKLKQVSHSFHGIREVCYIVNPFERGIFEGFDRQFFCGRYHSWVVDDEQFPVCLNRLASDKEGNIMAFRHTSLPVWGVQFHPESYMTENGIQLIKNWLSMC